LWRRSKSLWHWSLVQILCLWTLSIVLSLSKNHPIYFSKHNVLETGFCLSSGKSYSVGPNVARSIEPNSVGVTWRWR
jgi:hypothetical protein